MSRWERLKTSLIAAGLAFLIQIFFLIFDLKFVNEATGRFEMGTEFRFKFLDETTHQFVLADRLQKLPEELWDAACGSVLICVLVFLCLSLWYRLSRSGAGTDESGSTARLPFPKKPQPRR